MGYNNYPCPWPRPWCRVIINHKFQATMHYLWQGMLGLGVFNMVASFLGPAQLSVACSKAWVSSFVRPHVTKFSLPMTFLT